MLLRNKIYLTFDIDWAADHIVNHLIDLCLLHKVSATFFATHESKTLETMRQYSTQFEIAIHPNFLLNSTQGDTEEEIFSFCKQLVPSLNSVRTHCVYQHGRLYDSFNKHFSETLVESSICMPGVLDIKPFKLYTPNGCIIRVPFFWADDYYLLGKQRLNPISLLSASGCKVYMFHPIHLYHNTTSMEHYEHVKEGKKFNPQAPKGIGNLFKELLDAITRDNIKTGLMKEFLDFEAHL